MAPMAPMDRVADFVAGGSGPVAVAPEDTAQDAASALEQAGYAVSAVAGADMPSVDAVFAEFAAELDFPGYFGGNKDAFDECMRELDDTVGDAPGYAVIIRDAELLLRDEPGELEWFADAMGFYAEHYTDTQREFRVVLAVVDAAADTVAERWRAAGLDPAVLV